MLEVENYQNSLKLIDTMFVYCINCCVTYFVWNSIRNILL